MYTTQKKIFHTLGSIFRLNGLLTDSSSHGGAQSTGNVIDGMANGLATGFWGTALIPEAAASTYTPQALVAASAGGDLATPVAYWFQRFPLRVRVGSTTASAVPATSGILPYITERDEARGVLRMGLADVNAAAQIILDQGGLQPITTAKDFEAHFHICNVTNGSILATDGFADIGLFGGAIGVSPAAVANAAALYCKITAGRIYLTSTATTDSVIGTTVLPVGPLNDFVLSFNYSASTRRCYVTVDGKTIGSNNYYYIPTTVTTLEIGARTCHLAAYLAASAAPLGVDFDGIIVNQFPSK